MALQGLRGRLAKIESQLSNDDLYVIWFKWLQEMHPTLERMTAGFNEEKPPDARVDFDATFTDAGYREIAREMASNRVEIADWLAENMCGYSLPKGEARAARQKHRRV